MLNSKNFDNIQLASEKIYKRLFSDSVGINNEISFVLNEFETKYHEREIYKNNETRAMVDKLNEMTLPTCDHILSQFPILIDSLSKSNEKLKKLLNNPAENRTTILEDERIERDKIRAKLLEDKQLTLEEINKKYTNEIQEMENQHRMATTSTTTGSQSL